MKKHIALLFLGLLIGCHISAQQSWYTTPKGLHVTNEEIIHAINRVENPANWTMGWQVDSTLSGKHCFAYPPYIFRTGGATSRGIQTLFANTTNSRNHMESINSTACDPKTGTQGQCYEDDTSGPAWNSLDQIAPQPFYDAILINYSVEGQFSNTYIRILSLEGWEKAKYLIQQKGKGHLMIPGSTFANGIFVYELIVDGQMVASREMVLTR